MLAPRHAVNAVNHQRSIMLVRHVNPTLVGTFGLDFFLLFCTLVSSFSGFNSLRREFVETDNCGPPLPRFTSQLCSPAKNLTDKLHDISTLQIFQPFSLFCNARAGKLSCRTVRTNIMPKRPNLIVLSFKLHDPFQCGCSWKT